MTLTTTDGQPLPADVTVDYANGAGTAVAGTHYDAFSGTLTFAGGHGVRHDADRRRGHARDRRRSTTPARWRSSSTVDGRGRRHQPRRSSSTPSAPRTSTRPRPPHERVDDLLGRMTLAEKIGQMTQAERLGLQSPAQIADLGLGSVLSGGGSVPAQNTADRLGGHDRRLPAAGPVHAAADPAALRRGRRARPQQRGRARRSSRTTSASAPRATPTWSRRSQRTTAQEVRATGVPWTFAPCLCVTRDERWGRSYESFGEDPALVTAMADAAIVGLQGSDPTRPVRAGQGPRDGQALGRRRRHHLRPGARGLGLPDRPGHHPRRQPGRAEAAARRPVRARDRGGRRLDHAVVLGGLDRGRGPGPDARERRPEHRPAQGRARLRRVPHQRLGGHRQAARRHVRRQGGPLGERRASTWRWRRTTSGRSSPRSPARSARATSRRSGSTTRSAGS